MASAVVRPADPARDAAACAAVYAPYVTEGWVSFEEDPPDAAEIRRRMEAALRWLVADGGTGRITGFAYATPHRPRPAYRWTVETTVYVEASAHRHGTGRTLYERLLDDLAGAGLRTALAVIALPNPASVGLHESLGFELVGVLPAVGYKAGAWRDVGWWWRSLAS